MRRVVADRGRRASGPGYEGHEGSARWSPRRIWTSSWRASARTGRRPPRRSAADRPPRWPSDACWSRRLPARPAQLGRSEPDTATASSGHPAVAFGFSVDRARLVAFRCLRPAGTPHICAALCSRVYGGVCVRVLGVNAVFHDPAAALVVDGRIVAAAEEERFSRRKHGKRPVPWSAWELPEQAMRWCLEEAGLRPADLDRVGYSFDPSLCVDLAELGITDPGDRVRIDYARRAPNFIAAALPGLDPAKVTFVQHHVAHAASAGLAAPYERSACLVLDGRGERASHLGGLYDGPELHVLATQDLPHSLGLLYEDLTEHLGFLRSSDEYKVMAFASYGKPRHLADFRELVRTTDSGGFRTDKVEWACYAPKIQPGDELTDAHADLACSVQRRLEEVMLELAIWLHEQTGARALTMAGGTALNCVANSVLARSGPYEHVWVQPAAGDAGTSLGAALQLSTSEGRPQPMRTPALGRGWT